MEQLVTTACNAVLAEMQAALKAHGFGVLTGIGVQATMKAKLGSLVLAVPDSRFVQSPDCLSGAAVVQEKAGEFP